jgi:hypothetical protein
LIFVDGFCVGTAKNHLRMLRVLMRCMVQSPNNRRE